MAAPISAQQQMETLLRLARKWRRYGIAAFAAVCLVGVVSTLLAPTTYTATCTISVDESTVSNPLLRDLNIVPGPQERLAVVTESIRSWPVLQPTALEIGAATIVADSTSPLHYIRGVIQDRLMQEREVTAGAAISRLQRAINVRQFGRGIVEISYTGLNGEVAARVVNSVVDSFLAYSNRVRREGAQDTVDFIREQLDTYKQRLEFSEAAVREFREQHLQVLPNQFEGHLEALAATRADLVNTEINMREATQRVAFLEAQLGGTDSNVVTQRKMQTNPIVQRIQEEITTARVELARLRTNYTDLHPRVAELRQRIADLEQAAAKEEQRTVTEETSAVNPVYEQLEQSLHEARIERDSLELRHQALLERIEELEKAVRTIPEQEQSLVQLTRDNAVNESIYNLLLKKLEEAKISQRLANQQRGLDQFKIIEPARPADAPTGPNRLFMLLFTVALGLGAGMGAVFVRQFFDESFDNAEELAKAFDIPCLAIIPRLDRVA